MDSFIVDASHQALEVGVPHGTFEASFDVAFADALGEDLERYGRITQVALDDLFGVRESRVELGRREVPSSEHLLREKRRQRSRLRMIDREVRERQETRHADFHAGFVRRTQPAIFYMLPCRDLV